MQIKCVSKKTRIIIGHQHDYWRELKEALRVHTSIYIPPKIGKNMIFLREIVIFHTKYPNNVRASLRSTQFF